MFRSELCKREALHGEFISECSKLLMDALTHTLQDPAQLMSANATTNASGIPRRTRCMPRRAEPLLVRALAHLRALQVCFRDESMNCAIEI